MDTIGIVEARTRFAEICETISSSGRGLTVTRRGRPLVRIEPVRGEPQTIAERRAAYDTIYRNEEPEDAVDFEPPRRSGEIRQFQVEG